MTIAITPQSLIVRNGALPTTPVDGELVVLNMATDNYVGLDGVATSLWSLLETPIRVDDVCAKLIAHYAGTPATITADTTAFIQELLDEGLVRVVAD